MKLIYLSQTNYTYCYQPTRTPHSGQVDEFRNPMKNELKTTLFGKKPVFKMFLNLHIHKLCKTKTLTSTNLFNLTFQSSYTLKQYNVKALGLRPHIFKCFLLFGNLTKLRTRFWNSSSNTSIKQGEARGSHFEKLSFARITSGEVIIAEYDAILSQWE